jgi:hypothetical protein
MPGTALSLLEREEIALARTEDSSTSWTEIARRTRRHPTTIMGRSRPTAVELATVPLSPNAMPAQSGSGLVNIG